MPTTREDAIRILADGRERMSTLTAHLIDDQTARRATLGGGDWSVKDLIDHIAAWERRALAAIERWRADEPVEALIGVAGIDAINAANVAAARRRRLDTIRRHAGLAHDRLVAGIRSLSDADWRSQATMSNGRRHRLGGLLGGITGGPGGDFHHADAHLLDLEAYVASLGPR